MKRLSSQLFIVLISGLFSYTVAAEDEKDGGVDDLDLRGSDCILIRTIRDYTPLNDRNLLVWGPAKRGYYVSLIRPAFGMRSSFRLGFSSRDGRLCPYGGDSIVFDGVGGDSIRVRAISRVSEEQAEEILIRYGKKDPPGDQTPAPADVKGAEVEELD